MALFDLRKDPDEKNNVAHQPEYNHLIGLFQERIVSGPVRATIS